MKAARVRLAAGLALALGAACAGGLLFDQGNAFPCNYSQDSSVRDIGCPTNWVCSVHNKCQPFVNEGVPSGTHAPDFSSAGLLLYPRLLRDSALWVTSDPKIGLILAATDAGTYAEVLGQVFPANRLANTVAGTIANDKLFAEGTDTRIYAYPADLSSPPIEVRAPGNADLTGFCALRTFGTFAGAIHGPCGNTSLDAGLTAAQLVPDGGSWVAADYVLPTDAGFRPLLMDFRPVPRALVDPASGTSEVVPVGVTLDAFVYPPADAGTSAPWIALNDLRADAVPLFSGGFDGVQLRHSPRGELWVLSFARAGRSVLSTWTLDPLAPGGPAMRRAWSDCSACGGDRALLAQPAFNGQNEVQVICQDSDQNRTFWRISGSSVSTETEFCLRDAMDPAIDPAELNGVDDSLGGELLAGGRHGQLWVGDELNLLTPVFLDRTPFGTGRVLAPLPDGGTLSVRLAVTDRYLAADTSNNGLLVSQVDQLATAGVGTTTVPAALAREGIGWFILNTSDIAWAGPQAGAALDGGVGLAVRFGPRLLDPTNNPAPGPFWAEGLGPVGQPTEAVNLRGLIVTAKDSLYFYPLGTLTLGPNNVRGLSAELTPEPNVPIRSIALDRPASHRSSGEIHGYLLTSRNIYAFALSGAPLRWNAQPLDLAGGEPVKVWMHSASSSMGRVGYRDGTIFTLPGGFQLTDPFPQDAGTAQVLDYANLGGWPVALVDSDRGVLLYSTARRPLSDGGTGIALEWVPVATPSALSDDDLRQSVLDVARTEDRSIPGATQQNFWLQLFASQGQVYSIGTADAGT